jgi:hypothetical protein
MKTGPVGVHLERSTPILGDLKLSSPLLIVFSRTFIEEIGAIKQGKLPNFKNFVKLS